MINLLRRLLKEPDEDPTLIEKALKISQQFDRIHLEVQNGLKRELVEEQMAIVDKALEELPRLEMEFRAFPSAKDKRIRRYMDYFPEVISTYLLFCQYYRESLDIKTVALSYLKEVMKLLEEAQRSFKL